MRAATERAQPHGTKTLHPRQRNCQRQAVLAAAILNLKSMVCINMTCIYKLSLVVNHNPHAIVALLILKYHHPRLDVILPNDFCNVRERGSPLI
jgi:hypothetical protein